ncbi:MAG: ParA family protein [Enterococcus sp.]|nr:ParA family protein [Enterococcus sp.]
MNKKLNIIVMANHKGGVTKTTSTLILGSLFATDSHKKIYKPYHKRTGSKTLLIDLDSQGNLTHSVLTEEQRKNIKGGPFEAIHSGDATPYIIQSEVYENLYILPSTPSISKFDSYFGKYLEEIEGNEKLLENSLLKAVELFGFENILIDSAPSSSELLRQALSVSVGGNNTNVILPFTPNSYGWESLMQSANTLNSMGQNENPNLRIMCLLPVLLRKGETDHQEFIQRAKNDFGDLVSDVTIFNRVELEKFSKTGFTEQYSTHRKALEMYYNLFKNIKEVL